MPTEAYFCKRCNNGEQLLDHVYRVQQRMLVHQLDKRTGVKKIVRSVTSDVYEVMCKAHYEEALDAGEI